MAYGRLDAFASALLVGVSVSAILGLPIYLVLSRMKAVSYVVSALAGFCIGAIPIALLLWPGGVESSVLFTSSGGVVTSFNGIATSAGWQNYWLAVVAIGGVGAASGAVFHAVILRGKANAA